MGRKYEVKPLVEGALLSAITILLALISIYIPLLGLLASFIWPVPIILLGIRHGLKISILATLVSGLIIGMFSEPLQAFTVVFGFGLIGVAIGYAFRKNYTPSAIMGIGIGFSLLSKVILIVGTLLIMGLNPVTQQLTLMQQSFTQALGFYRKMGIPAEQLRQMESMVSQLTTLVSFGLPVILVMASVMDTFLNFAVARLVLRKLGHKIADLPPFSRWQIPRYSVLGYLLAMLIFFIDRTPGSLPFIISLNLQLAFNALFLVQGLSVAAFYLQKYNVNKALRVFIFLLLLMNPLFSQIAVWVGMFETFLDLRRIKNEV